MKKFIALCKKPLLIVSAVLTLAFLVLLIVGYTTPLGKTYAYKKSYKADESPFEIAATLKQEITLVDDKNIEVKTSYVFDEKDYKNALKDDLGDRYSEEEANETIASMKEGIVSKGTYSIKDGKLVTVGGFEILALNGAKVGAYTISVEVSTSSTEKETVSYACTANTAVQITSIVFLVVFVLATAGCVTVLVLDKKGLIKTGKTKKANA